MVGLASRSDCIELGRYEKYGAVFEKIQLKRGDGKLNRILNPALPVSPYLAIADILQKEIDSGHYVIGEPLPSEADLSRRFKVNRYTIRHSLDFMNKKGVKYRGDLCRVSIQFE
jgi:hypothetical protein